MNENGPNVGDIIFVDSGDFESVVSKLVQWTIDPDARVSARGFSHVAIVISGTLALEAVPAPESTESFQLPNSVEVGAWTGAELRGGVRLVPIADLIMPTESGDSEIAVLRSTDRHSASLALSPHHPEVLRLLGSQYSIETLKKKALEAFPKALAPLVGGKGEWTSSANDLAALTNIDPEMRQQISSMLPDYIMPEAARTYFCSQLVIVCLEVCGLLSVDGTAETTPTGLFGLLTARKWMDVTPQYYQAPEANKSLSGVEQYLQRTKTSIRASYYTTLALTDIEIRALALRFATSFVESSFKEVERFCSDTVKKLDRSDLK